MITINLGQVNKKSENYTIQDYYKTQQIKGILKNSESMSPRTYLNQPLPSHTVQLTTPNEHIINSFDQSHPDDHLFKTQDQ